MIAMPVIELIPETLVLSLYNDFIKQRKVMRDVKSRTIMFQSLINDLAEYFDITPPRVIRDYDYCRRRGYDAYFYPNDYTIGYRYLNTTFCTLIHEIIHAVQYKRLNLNANDYLAINDGMEYKEKPEEQQAYEIEAHITKIILTVK